MCSFLVTTLLIHNLTFVNRLLQLRGPDATALRRTRGITFVHNLLSIAEDVPTGQPGYDSQDDVVVVFNGEIYNHRELNAGKGTGETEALLAAYRRHGHSFPRNLDGEFALALVDFRKRQAVLSADVFRTKPVWYARQRASSDDGGLGGHWAVSSYASALRGLGFHAADMWPVPANTAVVLDFGRLRGNPPRLLQELHIHEFDMRQFKTSAKDWETAFEAAVRKRALGNRRQGIKLAIGLSAGYDSGAIHLALTRLGLHHFAFTLTANEDVDTLKARCIFSGPSRVANASLVTMSVDDFSAEHDFLQNNAEPVGYDLLLPYASERAHLMPRTVFHSAGGSVSIFFLDDRDKHLRLRPSPTHLQDEAAQGLSAIARLSRAEGALIYLSGSGADEILSDYGYHGKSFGIEAVMGLKLDPNKAMCSTFAGEFPAFLSSIFPWPNFFQWLQHRFLMRDESVLGSHGMEARYPFLDKRLVQEFLWLAPEVKNQFYKAPLDAYFKRHEYPFRTPLEEQQKHGFKKTGIGPASSGHKLLPLPNGMPGKVYFAEAGGEPNWFGMQETRDQAALMWKYASQVIRTINHENVSILRVLLDRIHFFYGIGCVSVPTDFEEDTDFLCKRLLLNLRFDSNGNSAIFFAAGRMEAIFEEVLPYAELDVLNVYGESPLDFALAANQSGNAAKIEKQLAVLRAAGEGRKSSSCDAGCLVEAELFDMTPRPKSGSLALPAQLSYAEGYWPAAPEFSCFDSTILSWSLCCDPGLGPSGNPACWGFDDEIDAFLTFSSCCRHVDWNSKELGYYIESRPQPQRVKIN